MFYRTGLSVGTRCRIWLQMCRHRVLDIATPRFIAEWADCLATRSQRNNRKMARIVLVHGENIGLSTVCYARGASRRDVFPSWVTELGLLSVSMFGMCVLHVLATLLLRRQLSWSVCSSTSWPTNWAVIFMPNASMHSVVKATTVDLWCYCCLWIP